MLSSTCSAKAVHEILFHDLELDAEELHVSNDTILIMLNAENAISNFEYELGMPFFILKSSYVVSLLHRHFNAHDIRSTSMLFHVWGMCGVLSVDFDRRQEIFFFFF